MLKTIGALKGAMKDKDSDEIKVAMDKAKREEAKKTAEVAKAKTGELKDKIFDESQQKMAAFKAEQEAKAK